MTSHFDSHPNLLYVRQLESFQQSVCYNNKNAKVPYNYIIHCLPTCATYYILPRRLSSFTAM